MPRQLLRDGAVAVDEWVYLKDVIAASTPTPAAPPALPLTAEASLAAVPASVTRLILPFDQWQAGREVWLANKTRLGIVLSPIHKVEDLAPDLARFELIAAEFPGPSDGRGYTQGRLLRERYAFKGELRATGYVRYDQIFFLARCGFNSFELPEAELPRDGAAFKTFSARYQTTNDVGLPTQLRHR